MRLIAVCLLLVVFVAYCGLAQEADTLEIPPLPPEIVALYEALGEPDEIHPGIHAVLVWRHGDEALLVFCTYDYMRGWSVEGLVLASQAVPARWMANVMMAQAERRKKEQAEKPGEGF